MRSVRYLPLSAVALLCLSCLWDAAASTAASAAVQALAAWESDMAAGHANPAGLGGGVGIGGTYMSANAGFPDRWVGLWSALPARAPVGVGGAIERVEDLDVTHARATVVARPWSGRLRLGLNAHYEGAGGASWWRLDGGLVLRPTANVVMGVVAYDLATIDTDAASSGRVGISYALVRRPTVLMRALVDVGLHTRDDALDLVRFSAGYEATWKSRLTIRGSIVYPEPVWLPFDLIAEETSLWGDYSLWAVGAGLAVGPFVMDYAHLRPRDTRPEHVATVQVVFGAAQLVDAPSPIRRRHRWLLSADGVDPATASAGRSVEPSLTDEGSVAIAEGRFGDAIDSLERVVASDGAPAEAYQTLAVAYWRSGDQDAASRTIDRAVAARLQVRVPTMVADYRAIVAAVSGLMRAGLQASLLGDPEAAIGHWSGALLGEPDSRLTREQIQDAYSAAAQRPDLDATSMARWRSRKEAWNLLTEGYALYGEGEYARAVKACAASAALDPSLVEAQKWLGCAAAALGNRATANVAFARLLHLLPNAALVGSVSPEALLLFEQLRAPQDE
ncbi:tetratricopeptide repeat protein [Candidatus Poribacteria bacterium]|nr:tetratricopeptide repeat protein [Candidatus Poribacteria bacterium]